MYAPRTASRGLPLAIPIATGHGAPAQRFTAKAPSQAPGQRRCPYMSRPARALPVGAQTSVAKPLTAASIRPTFATLTYRTDRVATLATTGNWAPLHILGP